MSNLSKFISILTQTLQRHGIPLCMTVAAMGLLVYLAGAAIHRIALDRIVQGETVDWPYKPLSLGFQTAGVTVLVACSVFLFLLGAYDPFIDLFRGL